MKAVLGCDARVFLCVGCVRGLLSISRVVLCSWLKRERKPYVGESSLLSSLRSLACFRRLTDCLEAPASSSISSDTFHLLPSVTLPTAIEQCLVPSPFPLSLIHSTGGLHQFKRATALHHHGGLCQVSVDCDCLQGISAVLPVHAALYAAHSSNTEHACVFRPSISKAGWMASAQG